MIECLKTVLQIQMLIFIRALSQFMTALLGGYFNGKLDFDLVW